MTPARSRIGSRSRAKVRKEKRFVVSGEAWFVIMNFSFA
jgi:hypothetical protein